ncbi:MAG: PIN domain-containing protein [Bacteroidaceae bacterium]|nr:PIN domain-containing protein [Bacteroidaceae bacterium]
MKRVFVDANIIIDLLCERYPWFPDVLRLFSMGDLGQIKLYCSSLSLGTASYLMETRKMTSQEIFENIDLLCQMCTPTTVDAAVVKNALESGFTDFEDALQHCSAQTINADCIVTRNSKDFSASEIPVYELEEFIALMEKVPMI